MKYTTLTIIALILMSAVFMIVGCSDSKDSGVVASDNVEEELLPMGIFYIAAGKDDLDNTRLPGYLKDDLRIESAEVRVDTAGSKWEIVAGGKMYEVHYRDFNDDAKDAKAKFEKFVAVYNDGEPVKVDKEWDGGTLWIDGEKYKGRKVMQKIQKLLLGIAAVPGVAAAPLQPGGNVEIEKWDASITTDMEVFVCGTRGTSESPLFEAWLESSSGLGSRNKTWVYLTKNNVDAKWMIKELQTGDADKPNINWAVKEEYKKLN